MNNRILPATLALFFFTLGATAQDERPPDFTKGDPIPANAKHDWNLGATGMRGWMRAHTLVTYDARKIYVTKVDPGSPADGTMAVGDVILGVGGKLFSYGTHAGKFIPELEKIAHYFEHDEPDFPRHLGLQKANNIRETIAAIRAATDTPELKSAK